jgi:hypothetical protein
MLLQDHKITSRPLNLLHQSQRATFAPFANFHRQNKMPNLQRLNEKISTKVREFKNIWLKQISPTEIGPPNRREPSRI